MVRVHGSSLFMAKKMIECRCKLLTCFPLFLLPLSLEFAGWHFSGWTRRRDKISKGFWKAIPGHEDNPWCNLLRWRLKMEVESSLRRFVNVKRDSKFAWGKLKLILSPGSKGGTYIPIKECVWMSSIPEVTSPFNYRFPTRPRHYSSDRECHIWLWQLIRFTSVTYLGEGPAIFYRKIDRWIFTANRNFPRIPIPLCSDELSSDKLHYRVQRNNTEFRLKNEKIALRNIMWNWALLDTALVEGCGATRRADLNF